MENVNRIGVGFFAPDFMLKDSEGRKLRLSDFRGQKNLLLFFCHGKRSQFCLDWLDELNRFYDHIQLKETEVLSFTQDERWTSHRIKEEKKIRFPILKIESDPRFDPPAPSVSQQYGVQASESEGKNLYPAIFLVNKSGIICYRKVYTHPTEKLNTKELLCELDKLI